MDTIQIRLNPKLIKIIDSWIKEGLYDSRSEAIRDAVRRFVWDREVGSIKLKGKDSVAMIREIRKKLSKNVDLDEINNL